MMTAFDLALPAWASENRTKGVRVDYRSYIPGTFRAIPHAVPHASMETLTPEDQRDRALFLLDSSRRDIVLQEQLGPRRATLNERREGV